MKNKYRTMKIFDCRDMPEKMRNNLVNSTEYSNDSYIVWKCGKEALEDSSRAKAVNLAINKWLMKNGAELDEEVMISIWW